MTVPALSDHVIELDRARETRSICVLLIIQAVASFRSVPRILDLLRCGAGLGLNWTPHFTSVMNWTLRLGLGLLRQVAPTDESWLAIIDHSIDIGTKKALVVLRVSTKALSARGGAIGLEDCACVGLTISDKITGESVAADLATIFAQAGNPVAIVRDGDATLQKGVRLWRDQQKDAVPILTIYQFPAHFFLDTGNRGVIRRVRLLVDEDRLRECHRSHCSGGARRFRPAFTASAQNSTR